MPEGKRGFIFYLKLLPKFLQIQTEDCLEYNVFQFLYSLKGKLIRSILRKLRKVVPI